MNPTCDVLTRCLPDGNLFPEVNACLPNEQCGSINGRPACVCNNGFVSIGESSCQREYQVEINCQYSLTRLKK